MFSWHLIVAIHMPLKSLSRQRLKCFSFNAEIDSTAENRKKFIVRIRILAFRLIKKNRCLTFGDGEYLQLFYSNFTLRKRISKWCGETDSLRKS